MTLPPMDPAALIDPAARIERIDWAPLHGERPRAAGKNARLQDHGIAVTMETVRVTIGGLSAFGWSRMPKELAQQLVGQPAACLFDSDYIVEPAFRVMEFPLLDWLGRRAGVPAYRLVAPDVDAPLTVPCYDTSLYIDELHLPEDADAVAFLQEEARFGWEKGHRAFKIKVGRCAMHMPVEEGMRRDAAIVNGIRAAVGPDAPLMLDANNGLNLNLTKRLLSETAEARIFWMEEPFHEDPVLYAALKDWMRERGLTTLIADGEGWAAGPLLQWAAEGFIDVVQYDVRGYGFLAWWELGDLLQKRGIKAAPHNYGGMYGNYVSCHLAPAVPGFLYAEWDEATVPGVDASGYAIREGHVHVPDTPGFGLTLDDAWFDQRVQEDGWSVCAL